MDSITLVNQYVGRHFRESDALDLEVYDFNNDRPRTFNEALAECKPLSDHYTAAIDYIAYLETRDKAEGKTPEFFKRTGEYAGAKMKACNALHDGYGYPEDEATAAIEQQYGRMYQLWQDTRKYVENGMPVLELLSKQRSADLDLDATVGSLSEMGRYARKLATASKKINANDDERDWIKLAMRARDALREATSSFTTTCVQKYGIDSLQMARAMEEYARSFHANHRVA